VLTAERFSSLEVFRFYFSGPTGDDIEGNGRPGSGRQRLTRVAYVPPNFAATSNGEVKMA
jgi:hypothetical protein